jgi:hypothetical protein
LVTTVSGTPVAGVRLRAQLMLYRTGGGIWSDECGAAVTGVDGRFELRDVPREDCSLSFAGDDIVPGSAEIDARDPAALRLVVARRCHFRVQVDPGHGAEQFRVLDAAGQGLDILEIGTDGWSSSPQRRLENGRSGVLSVSERGVTLVLSGAGRELVRLPLRLLPGEVTLVRY